jgi:hypothetical protein
VGVWGGSYKLQCCKFNKRLHVTLEKTRNGNRNSNQIRFGMSKSKVEIRIWGYVIVWLFVTL